MALLIFFVFNSTCCNFIPIQSAPFVWAETGYPSDPVAPGLVDESVTVHSELSRLLGTDFDWNNSTFLAEQWHRRATPPHVKHFNNALVTVEGWIVDLVSCTAVRNGGCVAQGVTGWYADTNESQLHFYELITVSAHWGKEYWHFPMEALVAFAALVHSQYSNAIVHVSAKTEYVRQWCEIIRLDWSRVVTDTVHASKLVVPRMGFCGDPQPKQVGWLASMVQAAGIHSNPHTILLVKRSMKRAISNFEIVERETRLFARSVGQNVVMHDDSNLPSVREQLQQFANASVIVAPHGAAETFMVASRPGACVIEMMETTFVNRCYIKVAFLMRHRYVGIPLYHGVVNIADIAAAFHACKSSRHVTQ